MVGQTVFGFKYTKSGVSLEALCELENYGMKCLIKKEFTFFSHAKLTLWGNPALKIGEKMVIWKIGRNIDFGPTDRW